MSVPGTAPVQRASPAGCSAATRAATDSARHVRGDSGRVRVPDPETWPKRPRRRRCAIVRRVRRSSRVSVPARAKGLTPGRVRSGRRRGRQGHVQGLAPDTSAAATSSAWHRTCPDWPVAGRRAGYRSAIRPVAAAHSSATRTCPAGPCPVPGPGRGRNGRVRRPGYCPVDGSNVDETRASERLVCVASRTTTVITFSWLPPVG
jgi:hypothetical protein